MTGWRWTNFNYGYKKNNVFTNTLSFKFVKVLCCIMNFFICNTSLFYAKSFDYVSVWVFCTVYNKYYITVHAFKSNWIIPFYEQFNSLACG